MLLNNHCQTTLSQTIIISFISRQFILTERGSREASPFQSMPEIQGGSFVPKFLTAFFNSNFPGQFSNTVFRDSGLLLTRVLTDDCFGHLIPTSACASRNGM